MDQQHAHTEVNPTPKKRRRRRWLLWLLLFILLFPVFLTLILQIPVVQQWGSQRIASYLSGQFNTEVLIDGFRLKWTDEIQLNHVLIRDYDQDTMIYVGVLDANLHKPIRGFLDGKVNVEGLVLNDAYINVKFLKDDFQSNLDQVFKGMPEALDSAQNQMNTDLAFKQDEQEQFYLLKKLDLNEIRVRNYHEVKGKEENFYVPKGRLKNVSLVLKPLTIIADELWFENPIVDISNFDYDLEKYHELFIAPFISDTGIIEDPFPFTLTAQKTYITEGVLHLKNLRNSPVKLSPADQLDWNHLDVAHIEIDADSFYIKDWIFGAKLNSLQAQTSSGLNIVDADADRIRVTEQLAIIDDLHLETSMSTVDGDLKFIYGKYPDFKDFANKVRFDLKLKNSAVGIDDLITFSPGLKNNPFFLENNQELISIDGRILGYVNNLKGRSLNVSLGNKLNVNGLIDIRDFTDPNRTRINFNLQELSTDIRTIRNLVPNLNLPPQVNKLGNIRLNGEFNGLLKDFIAFGNIQTDIGRASFNMNLNSINGVTNAVYGGSLDLLNFDLGAWIGDPQFGLVSLNTSISEGRGISKTRAKASLSADIKNFEFRQYAYKNAKFTGLLEDQLINGSFLIQDENIDLNWEGVVELGEVPHVDVKGSLKHLDMLALRLMEDELFVSSDFTIDILDTDADRFTGVIFLEDLALGNKLDSMSTLDSILITSTYSDDSAKLLTVESEILSGVVNGDFRVLSLPNYFMNYFLEYNPKIANKLGLNKKEDLPPGDFDFDINVHNSQGFLALATDKLDTLKDVHIEGRLRTNFGFTLIGNTPELTVDNSVLSNLHVYADGEGSYTNLVTSHDGMKVGKINLSPLTIFGDLQKDTLFYVFNEVDFQSYFDQINVEGKMYIHEGLWQTQLYNSELQMFGEDWTISDNNFLRFGPKKLIVQNLNMSHQEEYIKIKSINDDQGLSMDLQGLPLQRVNDLINYDRINFGGLLSGVIQVKSLKDLDEISTNLNVPKLTINGDDFGEFVLTSKSEGPNEPVYVDLNLIKGEQRLLGLAEVIVPNKTKGIKGSLNSQITIEQFPANILEYFILNGLSNTTGAFHGSISAVGKLTDPKIQGDIFIPSSSFKIDILGTTYYLKDQKVHLDSDLIDATGVVLKDKFGNTARVKGGITHHNLAKLGFNARLDSDEILILETTKADNELYYGRAFAEVQAVFSGTTQRPIIKVQAENKDNSSFVINNDTDELSGGLDFILFDFDTVSINPEDDDVVLGVDFTIDMSVNEALNFKIILDESTRDIIQGQGQGDLIFRLNPAGEMSLFGDYVIDRGEYLFTYSVGGLVPVNKPFTIERGSRLQWSGDPFDADIDVTADYTVLAAPYKLIADQFGAMEEAKQKTDVNLRLLLNGAMLQPEIRFDIDCPELTGQLKSAVDIEVARLRTDQTEMQNQAASLILFRDFASNSAIDAGSSSVNVVANTISEFLSNQLSFYLTSYLSEFVSKWDFIDDIEFDVGYRLPSGEFLSAGSGSEVGIGTRITMANRRFELSYKGDYVSDVTGSATNTYYFNNNLIGDYILTPDRRWRLRAYFKQDQFYTDRRSKYGLGLAWRREYDNLEEYKKALKKAQEANRNARIK